jgi:arylsulfatase A-like enzyme
MIELSPNFFDSNSAYKTSRAVMGTFYTRRSPIPGRMLCIIINFQYKVIDSKQPYGLPLNLTTLPTLLKRAGYATHMIGKWHQGFCSWAYTPTYRGFDTFYGYYNAATDHFKHSIPLERKLGTFPSSINNFSS